MNLRSPKQKPEKFMPTLGTTTNGRLVVSRGVLGRPVKEIAGQKAPPVITAESNLGTPALTLMTAVSVQDIHVGRFFLISIVPAKV